MIDDMEFQKIDPEDMPNPPLENAAAKEPKFEDFGDKQTKNEPTLGSTINTDRNLDAILGISVDIQVVLGSASMLVSNLLKLGRGAVIPLDHRVGEPVEVVVNGRVVARGEGDRCRGRQLPFRCFPDRDRWHQCAGIERNRELIKTSQIAFATLHPKAV